MLRSDAQSPSFKFDNLLGDINSISVDAIAQIEKELDPYDLVSLVFLLYDVPDTALQRLLVYQRVSKDIGDNSMNLLYDWAQHVQTQPTWKYEFLEALVVCQLNCTIRKLGFNVHSVQKHYLPNNVHVTVYINPMKKALYKLCENITSDNLVKMRNALNTYDFNTTEYESFELILLELMCKKFITVDNINVERSNSKYDIVKFAKIIESISGLQKFAEELREMQSRLNNEQNRYQQNNTTFGKTKQDNINNSSLEDFEDSSRVTVQDFEGLFEYLNKLDLNDTNVTNLKSDTKKIVDGAYPIKNSKRIGVCYIINEEDFQKSINSSIQAQPLQKRLGSSKDQKVLEKTMSLLNFEVICHQNLTHKKMLECIKNIIEYRVQPDDSMFMLCILSHGVRGQVYAADSVKIKIDSIQDLLDEGLHQRKLDIPKIMILQACQVNNEEEPPIKLVADSPSNYHLKKANFLIYWATAPELEAYRHETKGSIFIQILCYMIQKQAKYEHLYDIFTKVTDGVTKICTRLEKDQVPIFNSTLTKKLFLQIPE